MTLILFNIDLTSGGTIQSNLWAYQGNVIAYMCATVRYLIKLIQLLGFRLSVGYQDTCTNSHKLTDLPVIFQMCSTIADHIGWGFILGLPWLVVLIVRFNLLLVMCLQKYYIVLSFKCTYSIRL